MPPTTITYRRAELYDQVWAEPMIHVAKKYGISDVGLRKVCKKLGVPMPGNAYWARVAAGKQTRRPPLMPTGKAELTVTRREDDLADLPPEVQARVRSEKDPSMRIIVSPTLERPHPLLRGSGDRAIAVWIGGSERARALRIMDTLLKAIEARGMGIEVLPPVPLAVNRPSLPKTVVTLGETQVGITLDKNGVGAIRLRIHSWGGHTDPLQLLDTRVRKLEDKLNYFMARLHAEVHRRSIIDAHFRERERMDAERAKKAESDRVAREEFEKREKDLLRDVNGWRLAKDIREYAMESLRVVNDAELVVTKGGQIDDRLSWAMHYADKVDPLFVLRKQVSEYQAGRSRVEPTASGHTIGEQESSVSTHVHT